MVTTVTTAATVPPGTATSLTFIIILVLVALLIQKEICSGLEDVRAKRLSRSLNIAIVPLLVMFVTTIVFKILDAVR